MIPPPRDAVAAVTHVDPYPYYVEIARRGLHRCAALDLWVAASAADVAAILDDDRCFVRPPAEPVPRALLGSPAGETFGRLVRMNEGGAHRPFKRAIATTLASLPPERVVAQSAASARVLTAELLQGGSSLDGWARGMSVHVVGTLLGVPAERLAEVTGWIDRLVGGFAPGAGAERIAAASTAAEALRRLFHAMRGDSSAGGLFAVLQREGEVAGEADAEIVVANAIGLLTQGYEATAGLIGNTVVALVRAPALRERLAAEPAGVRALLVEVLRRDPPVQNTRRWVARSGTFAGQGMTTGDCILLVLAAANRDPAAGSAFSFGAARHVCPGDALAVGIAEAALRQLLPADRVPERWQPTYRPSVNARVPIFAEPW